MPWELSLCSPRFGLWKNKHRVLPVVEFKTRQLMATPLESINVKVLVGVNIVCACLFIRRKSKAVCMENQDILACIHNSSCVKDCYVLVSLVIVIKMIQSSDLCDFVKTLYKYTKYTKYLNKNSFL